MIDNKKEVWKDIPNYIGMYQASNLGNVKSIIFSDRVLTKCITKAKRLVVMLSNPKRQPRLVHRLVAMAFLPNPENKPEVNHIDGNPANNRVENLEWVTPSENQKHAYRLGLRKPMRGVDQKNSKLSVSDVKLIRYLAGKLTNKDLGFMFGVTGENVSAIKRRATWGHI